MLNRLIEKIRRDGLAAACIDAARLAWYHSGLTACLLRLKTSALWSRGGVFIQHNGIRFLFSNSGDRQELLYHFGWNRYWNEETVRLRGALSPGAVIVDVGANLGFFTLLADSLCRHNAVIHAFEPVPRIFARLQKNILANAVSGAVLHNCGCGAAAAETEITVDNRYSGMSSVSLGDGKSLSRERIRVVTLDAVLSDRVNRIDMIKIDTEGYEPQVLSGAAGLIQRFAPFIYIELGGGKFYQSSCKALSMLTSWGYDVPVTEEQLRDVPAGVNFLAVPGHKGGIV